MSNKSQKATCSRNCATAFRRRRRSVLLPLPALAGRGLGVRGCLQLRSSRRVPSPAAQERGDLSLSDSHILKAQCDAELDALEGFQSKAHHLWTWLAIVGGPAAKPGHDPGCEGECPLGVWILLPKGLAFEPLADRFQDALI